MRETKEENNKRRAPLIIGQSDIRYGVYEVNGKPADSDFFQYYT
jgi:hypothetical protein